MKSMAEGLADGIQIRDAFVAALRYTEASGAMLWRDIACIELLGN